MKALLTLNIVMDFDKAELKEAKRPFRNAEGGPVGNCRQGEKEEEEIGSWEDITPENGRYDPMADIIQHGEFVVLFVDRMRPPLYFGQDAVEVVEIRVTKFEG